MSLRVRRSCLLVAAIGLTLLVGCATGGGSPPSAASRTESARELGRAGGFVPLSAAPLPSRTSALDADADADADADPDAGARALGKKESSPELPIAAWIRPKPNARCLHIYLEGDGIAWISRNRYSDDPTPIDPVGLRLALEDLSEATIVYLGRPCQYSEPTDMARGSACRPIFWTNARYGEAVLEALDQRLDAILQERRPARVRLVGYSGGGVLAALLAARRDDIDSFVTIAAPLDLEAWTAQAGVTPLVLSTSPMKRLTELRRVPQHHFVGDSDSVVPAEVTLRFVQALGVAAPAQVHTVRGFGHTGWPEIWAEKALEISDACSR